MSHIDVVCIPVPLSARASEPPTKFLKREGLDRASVFRGAFLGKVGVTFAGKGSWGCSFYIRNKLKSLMTKKNIEISTNNLVTFKS